MRTPHDVHHGAGSVSRTRLRLACRTIIHPMRAVTAYARLTGGSSLTLSYVVTWLSAPKALISGNLSGFSRGVRSAGTLALEVSGLSALETCSSGVAAFGCGTGGGHVSLGG